MKKTATYYILPTNYSNKGFTMVEVVLALAIVVILTTVTILLINPTVQFAKGRNTQRTSNITIILNAVGQNASDNRGSFSCPTGALPTTTARMAATTSAGYYNIASCLVPVYLNNLPYDPATTSAHYTGVSDYDTGYTISQNATTGRITISAPAAELGQSISETR